MEEELLTATPPAGQPVAPLQAEPGTGEAPSEDELTRDWVESRAKEAEEKAFRRAQGLITKTNAKIREEVSQLEQQLGAAGVTLDAQQKAKLEAQVTERVLTEASSEPDAKGQAKAQPNEPQQLDPVSQIAKGMMDEAGTVVYDNDPEAKLIDMTDPYSFIKSLPMAIQAKKERVEASTNGGNPTATPGVASGGRPTSPFAGRKARDILKDWNPKGP